MALEPVVWYEAYWSVANHNGAILVTILGTVTALNISLPGLTTLTVNVNSAEEMQLLVDLLRNERSMAYDSNGQTFFAGGAGWRFGRVKDSPAVPANQSLKRTRYARRLALIRWCGNAYNVREYLHASPGARVDPKDRFHRHPMLRV